MNRPLLVQERAFLEAVALKLDASQAKGLRNDISVASARSDGDFVQFDLRGYIRPEYAGHENLPYEGLLRDFRGGLVSVLVNLDQNDRLLELEFIWWDHSNADAVDWASLEIVSQPGTGDMLNGH